MKRIFAMLFACLLLLTATACGQADPDYRAGKAALEAGDYLTAYEHLSASKAPKAADLLEKLVFVPTEKKSQSANGKTSRTTYTYDKKGNLLTVESVLEGSQSTQQYTYNDQNHLLSIQRTGSAPMTTTYTYDKAGNRLSERREREGNITQFHYAYNAQNRCVSKTQIDHDGSSFITHYRYDDAGNKTYERVTYPDGHWYEESYTYNADGNLLRNSSASSDGDGYEHNYTYDKTGKLMALSYGDQVHTYHYNEAGQVEQIAATDGSRHSFTYDREGHILTDAYTNADGKTTVTAFTYDQQGNKLSAEHREGAEKFSFTYDDYGNKLTEEYYMDGARQYFLSYTWALHYYPNGVAEEVEQIRLECVNQQPVM